MPQLYEAFESRDDWTGQSDAKERRKVQNRLNQRARRRRNNGNKWTPLNSKIDDVRRGHQTAPNPTTYDALAMLKSKTCSLERQIRARQLVLRVVEATVGGGPTQRSDLCIFPLSSDHLIPLIHFNVWRAIVTNMILLGSAQMFGCNGQAHHGAVTIPLPIPSNIPPSLEPTPLQREVEHEPWIDLFPLPALRDALIRAEGLYDDCDLCCDMVGGIVEKGEARVETDIDKPKLSPISPSPASSLSSYSFPSRTRLSTTVPRQRPPSKPLNHNIDPYENKGLIIWGNPEYIGSWEVSEGFARKWGWMISQGCGDLLRATDSHRRARYDDPIQWEAFGIDYS